MNNTIVKTVPLPDKPENVPTLSLHVLAKNAESVLPRLIHNVFPHVQQARFVLNDATDASERVIYQSAGSYPGVELDVQHATSATHPHFYIDDSPATYEAGRSLSGERFEGPYTDAPLLADWSAVRNLGWDSEKEWRLFLDADDLMQDPEKLPGLLCVLRDLGADLAASRYVFGRGPGGEPNSSSYRERLARSTPAIRWEGRTHETLAGGLRRVLVEDCLGVTDLKDNWGRGVRVPGRCFKVLYHDARVAGWEVSARHLAYLVQECPGMMPLDWVAGDLLEAYREKCDHPEELAWVLCLVGEMHEARENYRAAIDCYRRAIDARPSAKAAFRLCRAEFKREHWPGCANAYQLGLSYRDVPQVLDDGPVYADSSKLLVAHALWALGKVEEARDMARECARLFPGSAAAAELRDRICGAAG